MEPLAELAAAIPATYEAVASEYDRLRSRGLMERAYLDGVRLALPAGGSVLDLGCGMGEPIARFFIEAGFRVTGVDVAPSMITLCKARFPSHTWLQGDMRGLDLGARFDAIVAWDSFFHLPPDDQRAMFAVFEHQAAPGASLLFTSGTDDGTAIGSVAGRPLYHASLASTEYERLLGAHGFAVSLHRVADPTCGEHTVWWARRASGRELTRVATP
jgi:SAM-dependent methyltransferase